MRKTLSAYAMILVLLGLLARASHAQPAPFEINVVLAQTGFGAAIGDSITQALRAVEQYVNRNGGIRGRQLRFVEVDDQSSPQVDVQLTNQILAKHPAIVFDGGPAAVCHGASGLYTHGPVMWCFSPAFYPEKGSYEFATGVDSADGMKTVLTYASRVGWKRIAVLSLTDIAGQEADKALHALLETPAYHDITPVAWEHFAPGDVGITTQLAKMRAASPQAVIIWASGSPIATFYTAMRDSGWNVPVLGSNAVQSYALTSHYGTVMPKDYYIYSLAWPGYARMRAGPQKRALATFFSAVEAAGVHPDGNTAMAWDSAMIAVGAFQKLGLDATPEQLRDYILNLHDYPGASGTFDFRIGNQRGLGVADCIVVKWNHATGSWDPVSGPTGTPLADVR